MGLKARWVQLTPSLTTTGPLHTSHTMPLWLFAVWDFCTIRCEYLIFNSCHSFPVGFRLGLWLDHHNPLMCFDLNQKYWDYIIQRWTRFINKGTSEGSFFFFAKFCLSKVKWSKHIFTPHRFLMFLLVLLAILRKLIWMDGKKILKLIVLLLTVFFLPLFASNLLKYFFTWPMFHLVSKEFSSKKVIKRQPFFLTVCFFAFYVVFIFVFLLFAPEWKRFF